MISYITGSKNTANILSGSYDKNDFPLAILAFERSGDMNLLILDDEDPTEISSIIMLMDFFEFTLSDGKFMNEFVDSIKGSVTKEKPKPKLKLIKGGLSNTGSFC